MRSWSPSPWGLVLLVLVAVSALPATASAGSVTLTSPPSGQTYSLAAGQSPNSGRVAVHLSAVRDRTGCPAAENITSLFYYEQKKDNEAHFGSVFQTPEDAIDGDRTYGVGTWQFRAGFRCTNDGPNGPNFYSSVVTIHVVPYGGTTPTPTPPTPTPPDPGVRASCDRMQSLVRDMSRTNNHIRNDIIPSTKRATTTLKYLSLFGKWGGAAIAGNPEIPGSPALALAYRAQGHAAKTGELYGRYVGSRAKQQVEKYDEIIAGQVREYESLCAGVTTATVGIIRSPLQAVTIAASARSRSADRLNAALGKLNANLTKNGAPAADVGAVRRQAAAAVKLVSKSIAARRALARKAALRRVDLRKADVPRALRKNPNVRRHIGESLASLLSTKPFKTLRTVLRAQPILP